MTKIDVLAVMDDAAAILTFDDNTVTARILGEARAAVAELIEASRGHGQLIHDWVQSGMSPPRRDLIAANASLAEALARIDGAA